MTPSCPPRRSSELPSPLVALAVGDTKTETVDPSTFSLGRAANRIFADGASAVFSSAGTPLTRIRLSSNHKGNSYPRDWRVARSDTFLTVSALLFPTQIGRASLRARVCQYVEISVGAGALKKKT